LHQVVSWNVRHIVTGKATADEAPKTFTRSIGAYMPGRPAPYAEILQLAIPDGQTRRAENDDRRRDAC